MRRKIVCPNCLEQRTIKTRIDENKTCLDEFDKVSKYLEAEFGVKTKFKTQEVKNVCLDK
ncbi:MAG: hypothetical protein GTO45_19040 [Candidatus Aminicenantes bacterium]|nr:hypothetical protein [Candidatus Aminicenantes bacterium]NIN20268.1 hypothetical protein [Candidatus Aminicenantes bacterium]NIN44047.1 hypothetical protein [Candidatus Aminicenantes bacterium]NIN86857.1 hypothetical protein [Candidatus Aminicenantes bacterium]NIO83118.1 hypothetical protein [Candidatus Aminicenantes bacterium]